MGWAPVQLETPANKHVTRPHRPASTADGGGWKYEFAICLSTISQSGKTNDNL